MATTRIPPLETLAQQMAFLRARGWHLVPGGWGWVKEGSRYGQRRHNVALVIELERLLMPDVHNNYWDWD